MIRTVAEKEITIGNRTYSHTLAIAGERVFEHWTDAPVAALTIEHFTDLLGTEPELVVLGTGAENQFAPRELVFGFAKQGVGFEVMTTAAAARTYNVLAGEGRRVAAVLYL